MSNKLSIRRATIRHPKICVAAACPPPPPPTAWPADEIPIEFNYAFNWEEELIFRSWIDTAKREETGWHWIGGWAPLPAGAADWLVDEVTQTGDLEIDGWDELFGDYHLKKFAVPVIWDTPTLYVINTWDEITAGIVSAEAIFTF